MTVNSITAVVVIDVATNTVKATINNVISAGQAAVNPSTNTIYVPCQNLAIVDVIDGAPTPSPPPSPWARTMSR